MTAMMKTRKGMVVSSGAASAGCLPIANASGQLDPSWFPSGNNKLQGTATAPNSGTHSTSLTVSFGTPFATVPVVIPVLRQAQICSAGLPGVIAVTAVTTTDFTVKIDVNDDDTSSTFNINVAPVFDWVAFL